MIESNILFAHKPGRAQRLNEENALKRNDGIISPQMAAQVKKESGDSVPCSPLFNNSRFPAWLLFDAQHFIVLGLYRFLEHAIRGPGV